MLRDFCQKNARILHNNCPKIFSRILGVHALPAPVSYTYGSGVYTPSAIKTCLSAFPFGLGSGYERCSCSWGPCCYQIFHSLRLCRFSTDRNETFTHINDNILHQAAMVDF